MNRRFFIAKQQWSDKTSLRHRICRLGYRLFDLCALLSLLVLAGCLYIAVSGRLWVGAGPQVAVNRSSNSVIMDSGGQELYRLGTAESGIRQFVPIEQIPVLVQQAFLATEDRRFYEHHGIDYIGILRAAKRDIIGGSLAEGGSSLTQQLARTLYLNTDKSFLRKFNETSIAVALEKRYSKQQILEMYLNEVYMGRGQYGIKAAARRYFGISRLDELQIWQVATLAAIPKGPSVYNPVDHYAKSKQRRGVVLALMHSQGLITREQMQAAKRVDFTPPEPVTSPRGSSDVADAVLKEAAAKTGLTRAELLSGGYTIFTGVNRNAQDITVQAFGNARNFPPDGKQRSVQGSMVILDQHTGEVKALVGGRDNPPGGLNRAILDARQPGSAFKPIIDYGPALESGAFTPQSLLRDEPRKYGSYAPHNLSGRYLGSVSMTVALQKSINAPAVWLLSLVGLSRASEFAGRLGIHLDKEDMHLSIALGGLHKGVSPLAMAQAYSVFANQGVWNEAHLIRRITAVDGREIYAFKPQNRQVISVQTAASITQMLRSVVQGGTGVKAQIGRPVAGKTGTTQFDAKGVPRKANRDLWFVGYTDEWTAAVWMGFDRTDRDHYMTSGSGTAAHMFAVVMKEALQWRTP